MLHFIESRIQKYANTWWEPYKADHPHFKHWWDNTRSNAMAICPDDLLGLTSASSIYNTIKEQKSLKKAFNVKTDNLWKNANLKHMNKLANRFSYAWCAAAYGVGMVDASYQQFHNDVHIGMAVGDWFLEKGDSIHHWYRNAKGSLHNWWEHDDHWWEFNK